MSNGNWENLSCAQYEEEWKVYWLNDAHNINSGNAHSQKDNSKYPLISCQQQNMDIFVLIATKIWIILSSKHTTNRYAFQRYNLFDFQPKI